MYFNAGHEVERKVERNKLREFIAQSSTKFSQLMYFNAGLEVERKVERNKLREFISQPSTKFSQLNSPARGRQAQLVSSFLQALVSWPTFFSLLPPFFPCKL